ncbi:MAG TPA: hypothetical protein VEY95_06480, partial [Azospirillaceae bacterium]|nr:hypothetical protein [Azospirillaceae bacterium]
ALRRLGSGRQAIEQEYRAALRLAGQQGAPALELRAATGLARWLAETGRHEDGRNVLRPVYDGFTEGFETRDLGEARALLDALR